MRYNYDRLKFNVILIVSLTTSTFLSFVEIEDEIMKRNKEEELLLRVLCQVC